MIAAAVEVGMPARRVAADNAYGASADRSRLRGGGLGYLAGLVCDHLVPLDGDKCRRDFRGLAATARTAAFAVVPEPKSAPACSHRTPAERGISWSSSARTYSAWLARLLVNPITSSPKEMPVTPSPSSSTTPARSQPWPDGNVTGICHAATLGGSWPRPS
jgi:hypothetical protein